MALKPAILSNPHLSRLVDCDFIDACAEPPLVQRRHQIAQLRRGLAAHCVTFMLYIPLKSRSDPTKMLHGKP